MSKTILALLVVISLLAYFLYKCHKGATIGQRKMPVPNIQPPTLSMVFTADKVMDADDLFIMKLKLDRNLSVFKTDAERTSFKEKASKFFKEHYGLPSLYPIMELRVNPKSKYQSKGSMLMDGGFATKIPKGMTLHGNFGGKDGVALDVPGILAYGLYRLPNGYVILYKSMCPMVTYSNYMWSVTPIMCDVEILESPNKSEIGKKGKAIGTYFNVPLVNGKNHIVIRNVLTLK